MHPFKCIKNNYLNMTLTLILIFKSFVGTGLGNSVRKTDCCYITEVLFKTVSPNKIQSLIDCTQIIALDVNLSGQKDRCAELEEEITRLRKDRDRLTEENMDEEEFSKDEQSSAHQLKIKELEKERSQLKQELQVILISTALNSLSSVADMGVTSLLMC